MTTTCPPLHPCASPPVATAPGCADCGGELGHDTGPRDGWQLDDGRTVCQKCAGVELRRFAEIMRLLKAIDGIVKAK